MRKKIVLILGLLIGMMQSSVMADIAIQSDLESPEYARFREKAAQTLTPGEDECAKFVNRMFLARFGRMMFGDAWTMQIKPENMDFLAMQWKLAETEFSRDVNLSLAHYTDRIRHFEQLYDVLNTQEYPIGVIGWVYHYSSWKPFLAQHKNVLPQSHVSFVAGKKSFVIENKIERETTIRQILEDQYGKIHDFEQPFVEKILGIKISAKMQPGDSLTYEDYFIEENFRGVRAEPLLGLFLRKHTGNRITPLLRPVSFSRISDEIIADIEAQKSSASEEM